MKSIALKLMKLEQNKIGRFFFPLTVLFNSRILRDTFFKNRDDEKNTLSPNDPEFT